MNDNQAAAADFKQRDAASYDDVTDAFDRYTERFTGAIAARVVEEAHLGPGERVLDVGSGTGVVTFGAARRLTGSGTIVGIDLSDGMLEAARAKSARTMPPGKVSFEKMDAEALGFPAAAFDCAVSMYALRHFPHPDRALAEMRRVLRPGGRLVVAVGSAPPLASGAGVHAALRRVARLLGSGRHDLIACGYLDGLVREHVPAAAPDEEAGWTHHHAMQGSVPAMVRAAGFEDVAVTWTGHDGVVETNDDFWNVQVTFSSLARKRVADAPADAVKRLRRAFDAGCDRARAAGGRLRYPTGALIVTGTAPRRPA